jgi:hypothetical protein
MHLLWRVAGFDNPGEQGTQQQYPTRLIPLLEIDSSKGKPVIGFPFLFDTAAAKGY